MCECILTNEVIGRGGIELSESECAVCLKIVKQRGTYYGIYCPNCHSILDDSDWRGSIARQMRERVLKKSRKELSEFMGIPWKEITKAETRECSEEYYTAIKKIIREGLDGSKKEN
jgi:hypothetical protein